MRVALLSPLFERVPPQLYGGTERVVYNLCRGLARVPDIEVVLFASGDSITEGKLVPVIEESLRLRKRPVDPIPYNFKMLALAAKYAHEFDLIHNHHDYWMLPLTEMTDTPILTTLHGRMDLPDLQEAFLSFPKSGYISISDAQRKPIPQLPWVRTIHHGLDVDSFTFYENHGSYLAFLGRISVEKRPEWAIEIAHRSGVPLKIAAKIEGTLGRDYYDTYVRPHVDGKFIEYVGEISEAEKSTFLGNALALVFPIDWPEPFGLVVIESLACGTPVLARPCGAVPELLKDGLNGYIEADLQKLSKRVRDLDQIKRLNCREWVKQKFSLQKMTEDYVHVYRHVASKRCSSSRHRWNILHPVQRTANGNTQG